DVAWIDNGEWAGPGIVRMLRGYAPRIVLYHIDDATGGRDGLRWRSMLKSLCEIDLFVGVRQPTVDDAAARGARRTLRVFMGYDEIGHAPPGPDERSDAFRSEVAFVGTWMRGEGRDRFLADLVEAGVPISIWGNRWQKSPLWPQLQAHWRGPALT